MGRFRAPRYIGIVSTIRYGAGATSSFSMKLTLVQSRIMLRNTKCAPPVVDEPLASLTRLNVFVTVAF